MTLLAGPGPLMVFQPIHRLDDGQRVGWEALARFPEDRLPAGSADAGLTDEAGLGFSPDVWFRAADLEGLGVPLEVAAIRAALERLPDVPACEYVAVNVGPETLLSGELARALHGVDLSRVVVELTEHHAIESEHVEAVRAAIDALHSCGAGVCAKHDPPVAMDDFGEGSASFKLLLAMRASFTYVKLDVSLTADIDADTGRQAIASAIVAIGRTDGFRVVAEGVETEAQLETLRALGVHSVQGYLLGRPGPLPEGAP